MRGLDPGWRARVVDLVRATREHPDVEVGSSVRGAIDLGRVADQLAAIRRTGTDDWHVGLAAAKASLTGRIRVQDASDRAPEEIVTQLWTDAFGAEPTTGSPDEDAAEGTPGNPEPAPRGGPLPR